jgi:uncharacterized protein
VDRKGDGVTSLFAHVLAAYATIAAPLLAYRKMRRLKRANINPGKVHLYRLILFMQALVIASVAALWLFGGVPAASLGIMAPHPPWLSALLGSVFIGYFAYVVVRQRQKGEEFRARMRSRGGAVMLPDTMSQLRWFSAMCLASGIAEEGLYRGFLFYYVAVYLTHVTSVEMVVLTSFVFGIGHAYQGWKGILSTTVSGLLFGALYALSGSLLLPAVVHSAGNLQGALILWPQNEVKQSAA